VGKTRLLVKFLVGDLVGTGTVSVSRVDDMQIEVGAVSSVSRLPSFTQAMKEHPAFHSIAVLIDA